MIKCLCRPESKDAVQLLRSQFAGFLDEVKVAPEQEELATFLTAQGVLLSPDLLRTRYRMASPFIDGVIRTRVIPIQFPSAPSTVPPTSGDKVVLRTLDTLVEAVKFFDKDLIRRAPFNSHKTSNVPVAGLPNATVPRESVYETELMRILANWLRKQWGWTVTGQWHSLTTRGKHRYSDVVIQRDDCPPIVLELLATGDRSHVTSHIERASQYVGLLSACEGWVVHFTCEDDYDPIWQTDAELGRGVNVVHFAHDVEFTWLSVLACYKNDAGARVYRTSSLDIA
jgi:hypothetical protein